MKEEIKEALKQIEDECLIDLPSVSRKRVSATNEIRLADILWLVRSDARRNTQSNLTFSEAMKEVVQQWDLEHDDLHQQFDSTILMVKEFVL